jgi:hypothetical protein
MALHDKKEHAMDREDGLVKEKPAVVLLSHIHKVWPENTKFLPTSDLIDLLAIKHPTVWGDEGPFGKRLTAHRLGKMLAQSYKIHSDRPDHTGPRGYARSDFIRPWSRMQVTPSLETGRSCSSGPNGPGVGLDRPDRPDRPLSEEGVAELAQTNGQRRYDTCTNCGQKMLILHAGQTTHPNCEPGATA